MILITWSTSHRKTKKSQKNDCPYKMEPESCGTSLEKQSVLSEKRLKDVSKQGMRVQWKENDEEIKQALADGDTNRISGLFKRLRKQGSASERR
jgi:hypothetical protein